MSPNTKVYSQVKIHYFIASYFGCDVLTEIVEMLKTLSSEDSELLVFHVQTTAYNMKVPTW